jgi:hypothetical protein
MLHLDIFSYPNILTTQRTYRIYIDGLLITRSVTAAWPHVSGWSTAVITLLSAVLVPARSTAISASAATTVAYQGRSKGEQYTTVLGSTK